MKITSIIKKNIKIIVVLLLLIFVYCFGNNTKISVENKAIKNQQKIISNLSSGKYIISKDADLVLVEDIVSTNPGDKYMVSYLVYGLPDNSKVGPSLLGSNSWQVETNLQIFAIDTLGRDTQINESKIDLNCLYQRRTFLLEATDLYKNLKFKKSSPDDRSEIIISDIKISRLPTDVNIENVKMINGLDREIVVAPQINTDTSKYYKFNHKNQLIGQVFRPIDTNIFAVALEIQKSGSGGLGRYNLQLRNYDAKISDTIISDFSFEADDLDQYRYKDNMFIFPLAAKVDPNQQYFLGLSNQGVKDSPFSTLSISASSDDVYAEGSAMEYPAKSHKGDLSFSVYSFKTMPEGNILLNSSLINYGNGKGVYDYEFSKTAADFLDIFQINLNGKKSRVYRNNLSESISASSGQDTSYVYHFNMIYPFKKLYFEAEQGSVFSTPIKVSYSYDTLTWSEIASGAVNNEPNIFKKIFEGGGTKREIYLKFTYDQDQVGSDPEQFNLINLKLHAELDIE